MWPGQVVSNLGGDVHPHRDMNRERQVLRCQNVTLQTDDNDTQSEHNQTCGSVENTRDVV